MTSVILRSLLVLLIAGATIELSGCATTSAPSEGKRPRKGKRTNLAQAPGAPGEGVEEGIASYYADSLAGRRTANGERYQPEATTCAHRTHRFGTELEVTAVQTGRTARCRVNDRGPYAKGRIIDVSKKVARELGMLGPGVVAVRVRAVSE
jgi:rare lipoprotein A